MDSNLRGTTIRVAALGTSLACLLWAGLHSVRARAADADRPNVVLTQVDDMARQILHSQIREHGKLRFTMKNTLDQIQHQGVKFDNYYVSDPICGPSRASLLTGRSTHNHGMKINAAPYGFEHFENSPEYTENLPVWLQGAGYETAHIGKFINGYGPSSLVPPGWDDWLTSTTNSGAAYYGSQLNKNGNITAPMGSWQSRDRRNCKTLPPWQPGACQHATDVQTALALREIQRTHRDKRPLFLSLDYNAPHDDGRRAPGPEPQPRFQHLVSKVKVTFNPSDGTGNESKPFFIRDLAPLSRTFQGEIKAAYRNEVVAMRGVDEGVGRIMNQLRANGELDNTYVIFTSDNGQFHGEHYIAEGKYLPYAPADLQPFLMRGPGIPRNATSKAPATNLDVASTILSMTGAKTSQWRDGKSILRLGEHPEKASDIPALLEGFNGRPDDEPEPFVDEYGGHGVNLALVLNYTGFATAKWKYVKYRYGDEELYDLARDPKEYWNLAADPKYAPIMAWARTTSAGLQNCVAATCRPRVVAPKLGPYHP